jgi:hypothetical protein
MMCADDDDNNNDMKKKEAGRQQRREKIISSFLKLLHFYLSTAENKHSNKKITNATKKLFTSVCSLGKLLLYK